MSKPGRFQDWSARDLLDELAGPARPSDQEVEQALAMTKSRVPTRDDASTKGFRTKRGLTAVLIAALLGTGAIAIAHERGQRASGAELASRLHLKQVDSGEECGGGDFIAMPTPDGHAGYCLDPDTPNNQSAGIGSAIGQPKDGLSAKQLALQRRMIDAAGRGDMKLLKRLQAQFEAAGAAPVSPSP